jgi:hypothetical protein
MYTIGRDEIVAQRVADLHRQAAKQRLLRELRASRKPAVHRRRIWEWLTLRRPRPAVMTRTHQPMELSWPAVARPRLAALAESGSLQMRSGLPGLAAREGCAARAGPRDHLAITSTPGRPGTGVVVANVVSVGAAVGGVEGEDLGLPRPDGAGQRVELNCAEWPRRET